MSWNYEEIKSVLDKVVNGQTFTTNEEKYNYIFSEIKNYIDNPRITKERMKEYFEGNNKHSLESTNFFEICVFVLIKDNLLKKIDFNENYEKEIVNTVKTRIDVSFKKKYLDLYRSFYFEPSETSQNSTIQNCLMKYLVNDDFVYLGVFYTKNSELIISELKKNYNWEKAKQLNISQKTVEDYDAVSREVIAKIIEMEVFLKSSLEQGTLPRVVFDVKSGSMFYYKIRGICIIGITHFQNVEHLCDEKMKELHFEIGKIIGQYH